MAPQAKKPAGGKSGSSGKGNAEAAALLMTAAAGAIKLLADPEVRTQIVDVANSARDSIAEFSRRKTEKARLRPRSGDDASEPGRGVGGAVRSKFGQGKLELRVDRLEDSVGLLRAAAPPEAEAALANVAAVLDQARLALAVAGNLPFKKRQSARREVANVVDDLESSIFGFASGAGPSFETLQGVEVDDEPLAGMAPLELEVPNGADSEPDQEDTPDRDETEATPGAES